LLGDSVLGGIARGLLIY